MPLSLAADRPVIVLDLETTGVNIQTDRIIELAMLKFHPSGQCTAMERRLDPGIPIPPSATKVHGLTNADLAESPRLASIIDEVDEFLGDSHLIGFGLVAFDLPLLIEEFQRAGRPFELKGRKVIDVLQIYQQHEPRSLSNAVRYYLGREHQQAHSARHDAEATAEVLVEQIKRYGLPDNIVELSSKLVEVDLARRFRRDEQGHIVFGFGKQAGRRLSEVARTHPDYLHWMLNQSFLDDVKELVRSALAGQLDVVIPP